MNKVLLLGACAAISLVPLGCRGGSDVPSAIDEPATVTDGNTGDGTNWVGIERKPRITKQAVVTSKYKSLGDGSVLVFRNDVVTISIPVADVIAYFEKHFAAYPNLTDEKALADKLSSEGTARREYRFGDFLPHERDRLTYCIGALLEEGRFMIVVNDTGETATEILACEYSDVREPLDADGGRIFLLKDGTEFLRIVEWIS